MEPNGVNDSNQVVISILDRIHSEGLLKRQEFERVSSIQRVPLLLRSNDFYNQFYDPKMVSIGPYHHGKPELEMMQKLKPLIAQFLFPNREDLNYIYMEILRIVDELRSCYDEVSKDKIDDFHFAQMMLLDCCLILALLEPCFPNRPFRPPRMVIHNFNLSFLSMSYEAFFLLENQLPFRVLKIVTSRLISDNDDNEVMRRINKAVDSMPSFMLPKMETNHVNLDQVQHDVGSQPIHLFELRYRRMLSQPMRSRVTGEMPLKIEDLVFTYGSITDLKSRGIYFKASKSRSLDDIDFTSYFFFGKLEIPPLFISSNFGIMVSNMISYEQSPYKHMKPEVTSYLMFLRSLINSSSDVKELRCKRIINTLGMSDDQIADVFRTMNWRTDDPGTYYEVRKRMEEHYNNTMKTLIAQLITTYFSNPWSFIVFAAAASGLALTIVQTYIAIHPKYSLLLH